MNRGLANYREQVIGDVLKYIYDITPTLHQNYGHTLYRSEQVKAGNGHILNRPDDNDETEEEINESEYHRPQCCVM
jgi:hypothetical protein